MAVDLVVLATNAKGWLAHATLAEIATVLDVLEDELLERRSPAAALVSQAQAMVRRQVNGGA